MPGALGGDLIKAVYLIRDQASDKTPVILSILVDRLIGFLALFSIAMMASLFQLSLFFDNPILQPILFLIMGVTVGGALLLIFTAMPFQNGDPIQKILAKSFFHESLFEKIYLGFIQYRKHFNLLVQAFFISVFLQLINILYFQYLTESMTGQVIHLNSFAAIYSVSVLISTLPISPAGLGVGHVAFDKLFSLIQIPHGANIFNVFFVLTLLLNLTGIIPYLLNKKKLPDHALS